MEKSHNLRSLYIVFPKFCHSIFHCTVLVQGFVRVFICRLGLELCFDLFVVQHKTRKCEM